MSIQNSRTLLRLGAFLFLVVSACLAYSYQNNLKQATQAALESQWFVAGVSIYIVCCAVMYQVFKGGNSKSDSIIHANLGKYADSIYAVFAYIPACTTSIALLKGIFMQHFFSQIYFSGFDGLDMISMLVVSSFLLYYSIYNSSKMLISAISEADSVEVHPLRDAI